MASPWLPDRYLFLKHAQALRSHTPDGKKDTIFAGTLTRGRYHYSNLRTGVALGYSQLTDADITNLPIPQLQASGFLLIWVINAKFSFTLDLFERWGYE